MVIDTSALLALFLNETHAVWVEDQLEAHRHELLMSTVNLTETLILLQDKQPKLFSKIKDEILSSGIQFIPPSTNQSVTAAKARLTYPINLGDCFAYALAMEERCPILTLDSDFKKTDAKIIGPK